MMIPVSPTVSFRIFRKDSPGRITCHENRLTGHKDKHIKTTGALDLRRPGP